MHGIICSHTHSYGLFLRSVPLNINPHPDLIQIIKRSWWPVYEAIDRKDAQVITLANSKEFIRTGTTCFVDTYSGTNSIGRSLDSISSAIDESGLRTFIGFEATERHTRAEGAKDMQENVRFLDKVKNKKHSRVEGLVSIYASFTSSDELLQHARRLSREFNTPLTIHASEGQVDLQYNLRKHGKRTIDRLHDVGLLTSNTVLTDCIYVNEDEISLIKRRGAKVVHNTVSNMRNGLGVAPVPKMLKENITIDLGNNGYNFDGFENIRSTYLIHKMEN